MKNIGLRQSIAKAETKEAVNDLLVVGTQYDNASAHTKRRWLNTARKRLKQLKIAVPVLMAALLIGCSSSNTNETATVLGPIVEVEIKGHTYLAGFHMSIIHAEHCKCKTQ